MRVDAVATHAATRPAALACVDLETGQRWTYVELDRAVNRLANWLISEYGPASGERIATVMRNSAEMLILNLACVRAGTVFVPFNWRLAPAEIQALVADAEPRLVFLDDEFSEACPADGIGRASRDMLAGAEWFPDTVRADARRDAHEASTLLYTSGTSGKPKGVMVSEVNAFWSQLNFNLGNDVSAHSVFLCDMPLFHTAGLLANARTALLAGGTLLISRGFEAGKTLARLSDPELGITHYFSVPQMAQMLWNHPTFDPAKLRTLKVYATGGAPNPKAQVERFVRAGIPMSEGCGMSETGSIAGMPVGDTARMLAKAGSVGTPYISVELRVVDEFGNDQARGQPGELLVRGPGVTRGYWRQPDATARAFAAGGWLKTGDVAICDEDGFYFLVDRRKDMYISGGENVYPAEVEACVAELPEIAEVAVVGVPDEQWGESGRAFVVAVPGRAIVSDDVLRHCQARLAKYKIPKEVVVCSAIPRTSSGKVQKHLLDRSPAKAARAV